MKITNRAGLPEPIVRAVENDPYFCGDCDISVTQLITPPQIIALRRKHQDQITEDVSDRIWALLGQSVHHMIDRASGVDDLQEVRLYMTVCNWRISGQLDNLAMSTGVITDYKVTSVYKVMDDLDPNWVAQLNFYAELARQNGATVNKLQIIAILRDWSKPRASREPDYPQSQVVVVPVPRWTPFDTRMLIVGRALIHQEQQAGTFYYRCDDEERWADPPTFAVMKNGNKRALRVEQTEKAAEAWMQDYLAKNADKVKPGGSLKLRIEERPGNPTKRCDHYCNVRDFCPQYAEMKGGAENVGTDSVGTTAKAD